LARSSGLGVFIHVSMAGESPVGQVDVHIWVQLFFLGRVDLGGSPRWRQSPH
jgi:hypothetical protein